MIFLYTDTLNERIKIPSYSISFIEPRPHFVSSGEYLNVAFTFTNNLMTEITQTFEIYLECYSDDKENVSFVKLDEIQLSAKEKEIVNFSKKYPISFEFKEAILKVTDDKNRIQIHSKLKYSKKHIPYQGYGDQDIQCVPALLNNTNIKTPHNMTELIIYAHGSDAEGYPIFQVWIDGYMLAQYETGPEIKPYFVKLPQNEKKEHNVDIVFINDNQIKEKKLDRNLYIDKVILEKIEENKFLIDKGKLEKAFDCEDIEFGNLLTEEGAVRFLISSI